MVADQCATFAGRADDLIVIRSLATTPAMMGQGGLALMSTPRSDCGSPQ